MIALDCFWRVEFKISTDCVRAAGGMNGEKSKYSSDWNLFSFQYKFKFNEIGNWSETNVDMIFFVLFVQISFSVARIMKSFI